MWNYIITLAFLILGIVLASLAAGSMRTLKKLLPLCDADAKKIVQDEVKNLKDVLGVGIGLIAGFGILFAVAHVTLTSWHINKYKSGEVVEEVQYRYDIKDGVRTMRDSTTLYYIQIKKE